MSDQKIFIVSLIVAVLSSTAIPLILNVLVNGVPFIVTGVLFLLLTISAILAITTTINIIVFGAKFIEDKLK